MHRSFYFRMALVGFLAGVGVASFLVLPKALVWALVVAGGLCLLRRPVVSGVEPRQIIFVVAGIILLAGAVGVHEYQRARVDDTPLYWLAVDKADVVIEGYLAGGVKQTASGWSFYLWAKEAGGLAVNERVLVRVSQAPSGSFGDGLRLTGRIGRAAAFDDFDYPGYLRKEGVRSIMIRPQIQAVKIKLGTRERVWVGLVRQVYAIGDAFSKSVRQAVAEPAGSYLVGILVGGRQALNQQINDQFARTSTSHVLAISGYNITILASAVMAALAGRLGRRRAMLVTILIIALFVIMTGAAASVVRAALMGVLILAAGAWGRQAQVGVVMLISAAVMIWFNPLILRDDVGFQLSFVALLGLVYLEPIIAGYLGRWAKPLLGRIVAATLAAQIAVLPILLYYFHTLSVIGPVANLLILPIVPLAMALGFGVGLLGLILPTLAHTLGLLAWLVASYQLLVVRYLASLAWSAFEIQINAQILVALYALLAIWWHLSKKPNSAYADSIKIITSPHA